MYELVICFLVCLLLVFVVCVGAILLAWKIAPHELLAEIKRRRPSPGDEDE